MTRTQHYMHPTKSFPVYCLDWISDDVVLLGGGGGASRSGIKNMLKLAKVTSDGRRIASLEEFALSNDEDAPMTLALDRNSQQLVTGINASEESVKKGSNEQARLYSYKDNKIEHVRSQQTIAAQWSDDFPYQKLTALSGREAADYVAVGSTDNTIAILRFPSLEIVVSPKPVEGGDLVDLNWGGPDGLWLAVTTASKVDIYELKTEKLRLNLLSTVAAPPGGDGPALSFRAARFAPETSGAPPILAVLNSAASRSNRRAARKAYIAKFDAVEGDSGESETEEKDAKDEKAVEKESPRIKWTLANRREVASKPITVFDVSADGRLVSFGCSDLSIGMLDAKTLSPLLKILQAHSFPPTALKFNPSGTLLVSASADNTIRTVVVPKSFGGSPASMFIILLALLVIVVAILMRK